jgi:amylosucrase
LSSIHTNQPLQQQIHELLVNVLPKENGFEPKGKDKALNFRINEGLDSLVTLYQSIYQHHPKAEETFGKLIRTLIKFDQERAPEFKAQDQSKKSNWFLSNELVGMSLYVDRFCGDLKKLPAKLPYLSELGVNFLHLMPLFESPAGESDGGYAVSNFQKVDSKFGDLSDLKKLRKAMQDQEMHLMLDIVLNHTSHRHEWAQKAKAGDPEFQDFYYMYDNRWIPNEFDTSMPEIFPETSPGNFTYVPECDKWVMTVFHHYQWDLNFMNPAVFVAMVENILFYANLGVDLLRIDAPAFIWKQNGTTSQNLPQAHQLLRLIKQCVQVSASGMALLGEAIVAPKEIIKYFGTGDYSAKECDFAYNATQMALQWDMLATGDTRVMLAAQHDILQKPLGTSWITYSRCHDDIGLGYEDEKIAQVGRDPYLHRQFLKDYYTGSYPGSPAKGALFSSNPKTGDARISGSLASLCGLEKAIENAVQLEIDNSIQKILLMQAHSFFLGGMPMLYYGDELGYTNDYSYQNDPGKSYDNRWMHRPIIDWKKNAKATKANTIEGKIFAGTKKLIQIRKQLPVFRDQKNLTWLAPHNIHVAGFVRSYGNQKVYCIFNFGGETAFLTWYAFKELGKSPDELLDHWTGNKFRVGPDNEYLIIPPYEFYILEVIPN